MRALSLNPLAAVALVVTAGCIARAPATAGSMLDASPAFAVASPSGPTLAPGELAIAAPEDGATMPSSSGSRFDEAASSLGSEAASSTAAAPAAAERSRHDASAARSDAAAGSPGAAVPGDATATAGEMPVRPAGAPSAMPSGDSALASPPPSSSCDGAPASASGGQGPGSSARRYSLLPEVKLAPAIEGKLAQIAEAFFRRTGKPLVVTSGTRDPERQAEAMQELLRLGVDVTKLYRNTRAAAEIARAFQEARAAGKPPAAAARDLAAVIRRQIERGVFVSAHLRAGAVDVRNRDMSAAQRRAFLEGVAEVGGVAVLDEEAPPHFHLQLE